jgi:N-methylhydantoinase A
MLAAAKAQLADEGFNESGTAFEWSIDLRYGRQVHEVTTPVRGETPVNDASLTALVDDFEALYERKFGKGSAYRAAGIEMTMFRLTARGLMKRPEIEKLALGGKDASAAKTGRRRIFVEAAGELVESDIYDFELLTPGNEIIGPAVIHTPITTIVLQDKQTGLLDEFRNMVIHFT